jgi:hypothetical protein
MKKPGGIANPGILLIGAARDQGSQLQHTGKKSPTFSYAL